MIRVAKVAPENDFSLMLDFTNGERRRFDVRPYLEFGVFQRLKNPELFKQARVAFGTVCWPGELDISPDTLYLESILQQFDLQIKNN